MDAFWDSYQKLIMGPWTHGSVGVTDDGVASREQGELVYPENSAHPPYAYEEALATMFIQYLRLDIAGWEDTADDVPTVQYYVMGDVDDADAPGNEWRTTDDTGAASPPDDAGCGCSSSPARAWPLLLSTLALLAAPRRRSRRDHRALA